MPPVRPFEHTDPDRKPDDALRSEARAHLASSPPLQLVAELLTRLRALDLPWWTPEMLRERWTATERLRWYRSRPDLRQRITSSLTGLAPKAARKKTPEFQGGLVDSVIDEGDVSARAFEDAFDPCDLVVYGPVESFWQAFIEKMPWGHDIPIHQELVAWLFDQLLADHSAIDGMIRKPILTALDARTSIDGRVWHTRMPLEIRVAIDDARFTKERMRSTEPFHAESDLSIAVAATIAASIPLRDLAPVFATAERAMGLSPSPKTPGPEPKKADVPPMGPPSAAPPPPPQSMVRASTPPPAGPPGSIPQSPQSGPRAVSNLPPPPAMMPRRSDYPPAGAPQPGPPPQQQPPPATRPSQGSIHPAPPPSIPPPGATTPAPLERPTAPSAQYNVPPQARVEMFKAEPAKPEPPKAEPIKAEAKPEPVKPEPVKAEAKSEITRTDVIKQPEPKSDPKAAGPSTSPRAAANTLLDALADIPAEEERTNPWDIPDDASSDGDTGVMHRREEGGSPGKRRRHKS